jgi:hypothetical protein
MTNFLANFCLRYLRPAAILCLIAGGCGLADTALALTRVEVYQVTVPLSDRSEAAQSAAFEMALKIVLIRVTGRRSAGEEAAFAPLYGSARRYVQQYRAAADSKEWVAFDGAAIERWLTQNGQPLWGRDRPSTFVWVSVQTGTENGGILTAEDTSELKQAIDTAAAERGIPLIWPTTAAASTGGGSPADLGHRMGAEGVLVGRASNATMAANVRWTLQFEDRSSEFSGPLEGVNHAADMYAGLFAASGAVAPVDIEVTGVADVHDYAMVQSYLESLNFITHVSVESLTGDIVKFRLTSRGGIDSLQHAVILSGKLQSLPAGDNGVPRFQLRR